MRFMDSCCGSAVLNVDILLWTQVLTPTSTGRMKKGSGLPRSSQKNRDCGGIAWSSCCGSHQ